MRGLGASAPTRSRKVNFSPSPRKANFSIPIRKVNFSERNPMQNRAKKIRAAASAMRADADPRWHAVADLLEGGPLGYAALLDGNPRQNPANYPDADRAIAVADAYLARS